MNDKTQTLATTQSGGTIQRQGFASQELAVGGHGDTVASVLAARAKAEVEARFIVAMQRPRDWDLVRQKMLAACERPGFAGSMTEKVFGAAWYRKPVGDGVEGFSVRFAEEAIRCMGNLDARSDVVWEDDTKRIVSVTVMDLEANVSIPTTLVIEKTVERKYLKKGQDAISARQNSRGEVTYTVEATPDEVLQRQNSLISKAIRNGVLRLLPGDIQAECRDRIMQIRHGDLAKDPAGFRRKVIDGFGRLGINAAALKKYIGHELETCTKTELAALRDLWQMLDDGKITWHEVVTAKAEEDGEEPPTEEEAAKPKSALGQLTDRLKRQQSKPEEDAQAPENGPESEEAPEVDPEGPDGVDAPEDAGTSGEFDPVAECFALADQLWGAKAGSALAHEAARLGVKDIRKMGKRQADKLLDVLTAKAEEETDDR